MKTILFLTLIYPAWLFIKLAWGLVRTRHSDHPQKSHDQDSSS